MQVVYCVLLNDLEPVKSAVAAALQRLGPVRIKTRWAPAWTTDWISEEGQRKLREYGIAPPTGDAAVHDGPRPIRIHARHVDCPRCGSAQTEKLSAFGSTACKALYRCEACREPFEHVKEIGERVLIIGVGVWTAYYASMHPEVRIIPLVLGILGTFLLHRRHR